MLRRMINAIVGHARLSAIVALGLSALMYHAGFSFFFLVVITIISLVVLDKILPGNSYLGSLVSKLVISLMVFISVMQLALLVQFYAAPTSNFTVVTYIMAVFYGVIAWVLLKSDSHVRSYKYSNVPVLSKHNILALLASITVLIAFLPILMGDNTYYKIAEIGSGQAIDGASHYAMIAESGQHQHYRYVIGKYYPVGFHMSMAYIQNAIGLGEISSDWKDGALTYLMQYLVWGILLVMVSYELLHIVAGRINAKSIRQSSKSQILTSVLFGILMTVIFVLPFIQHGFLNFFALVVMIIVALSILLAESQNRNGVYRLFLALLIFFGAGSIWPLITPPLILTGLIYYWYFIRGNYSLSAVQKILLILLLALQLVPIIIQVVYYGASEGQGINLTGDLRSFHYVSLIFTLGLSIWIVYSDKVSKDARNSLLMLILPFQILVVSLALIQLATVGEIRYYAIKTHLILELLTIVLLWAFVIQANMRHAIGGISSLLTLALASAGFIMLIAVDTNPFFDIRNLFRTELSQEKPQYFDQDISLYTKLGAAGKIDEFNSTLMHYDHSKNIFYAHMQIPYWSNVMEYDGSQRDQSALNCSGKLYENLNFGSYTSDEQKKFVEKVNECISIANQAGREYFIVTDSKSLDEVREKFSGDMVKIVTE